MLSVKDINIFYGKKQVLFDVSFTIAENEKILLIGPNGAGKSTLLKAIAGLMSFEDGTIKFNGNDMSSWPTYRRINSGIGYLLQAGNIVPGLTVEENLRLGGFSLKKGIMTERINSVINIFKFLKDKLGARAGLLSGGERQALAIGMVLMKKPDILLLDEPSAGLAPKAAADVIKHIKDIQALLGIKAVCMVEHNLKFTLPWATKVAVLVGGRMVHISIEPEKYLINLQELEKFFFEDSTQTT
jgi:branched-chain amino acid transport system ATP-binding protein